jgi:hypothetical protein
MRLSRWITFPLLMGILMVVPALIYLNDSSVVEILVRFVIGAGIGFGVQAWSDRRTRQRAGTDKLSEDNYAVSQTRSVTVLGDREKVLNLCEEALRDLGNAWVKNVDSKTGEIAARTYMNWTSFGNKITLRVVDVGENLTEVTINTEPALRLTRVDYGHGLEIAEKLMRFLKKNEPSVNTNLLRDGVEILATATKRPLAKDFDRRMAGSSD